MRTSRVLKKLTISFLVAITVLNLSIVAFAADMEREVLYTTLDTESIFDSSTDYILPYIAVENTTSKDGNRVYKSSSITNENIRYYPANKLLYVGNSTEKTSLLDLCTKMGVPDNTAAKSMFPLCIWDKPNVIVEETKPDNLPLDINAVIFENVIGDIPFGVRNSKIELANVYMKVIKNDTLYGDSKMEALHSGTFFNTVKFVETAGSCPILDCTDFKKTGVTVQNSDVTLIKDVESVGFVDHIWTNSKYARFNLVFTDKVKRLETIGGTAYWKIRDDKIFKNLIEIDFGAYGGWGFTANDLLRMTNLEIIGPGAFKHYELDESTPKVDIDLSKTKIKTIGKEAFCNLNLTSIILPDGLETIESRAFLNTPASRSNIIIPKSVKNIENDSFEGLTSVKIYDNTAVHDYFYENKPSGIDYEIIDPTYISNITIKGPTKITVGGKASLIADLEPKDVTEEFGIIEWSSNSPNISIDSNGKITGISNGVATIIAKDAHSDIQDTFKITVSDTGITIDIEDNTSSNTSIGNYENILGDAIDSNIIMKLTVEDKTEQQEEKDAIDSILPTGMKVFTYYDIKMLKKTDNGTEELVSELVNPLEITMDIPTEIRSKSTIGLIKVHNGVPEIVSSRLNETRDKITFKADKFSTFAIYNSEEEFQKNIETAGESTLSLYGRIEKQTSDPAGSISVLIPTKLDFIIDSNKEFISGNYLFKNTGDIDVTIKIKEVTASANTTVQLVEDSTFDNWDNISEEDTKSKMALKLGNADLSKKNIELIDLIKGQEEKLSLTGFYGKKWKNTEDIVLKYNVTLEIDKKTI